ncbi:MAG: hypothetical protein D6703_05315 [Zetaproteobacteria bacterium]|nr:MAG: hypothetical protein D6703_05315 [Zetaproteobacteria bacterium]
MSLPVMLLLLGAGGVDVDRNFDQTGDGLVDASDWRKMDAQARRAYARAFLQAIGENPDASLPDGGTRLDRYLQGLSAVYE